MLYSRLMPIMYVTMVSSSQLEEQRRQLSLLYKGVDISRMLSVFHGAACLRLISCCVFCNSSILIVLNVSRLMRPNACWKSYVIRRWTMMQSFGRSRIPMYLRRWIASYSCLIPHLNIKRKPRKNSIKLLNVSAQLGVVCRNKPG